MTQQEKWDLSKKIIGHYATNIKPESTGLKIGMEYTLIDVSENMAMTVKAQVRIMGFKTADYAQYENLLYVIVKIKRQGKKRFSTNQYLIKLKGSQLFLSDDVLKTDTENYYNGMSVMRGNARINLIIDPSETLESMKQKIEKYNDYKLSDLSCISLWDSKDQNKEQRLNGGEY